MAADATITAINTDTDFARLAVSDGKGNYVLVFSEPAGNRFGRLLGR
jgi:hypothetical protein